MSLGLLGLGFVYELWRHLPAPGDLWTFWAAARALSDGLNPYVFGSLTRVAPIPSGPTPGPFLSPLFVAQVLRPFGTLPFATAQRVWLAGNLALAAALVWLLLRLGGASSRWPAVVGVVAGLAAFQPLNLTLWLGQTDVVFVVAIAAGWLLYQRGRPLLGGLVMSVGVVDIHLMVGFGCALLYAAVARRQWRPLAGLAAGVAIETAACLLHPHDVAYWLTVALPHAQSAAIEPWDTVSVLQATSEIWGLRLGVVITVVTGLGSLLAAVYAWRRCRPGDQGTDELAVAAALTLVLTTFAYGQDFLVVALAGPLLLRLWRREASGAWLGALALFLGEGYGLAALTGGPVRPAHALFLLGAPLLALAGWLCLPGVAGRMRRAHHLWAAAWALITLGAYALLTWTRSESGPEIVMLSGILLFILSMAVWGTAGPRPATPAAVALGAPTPSAEIPAGDLRS